MRKRLIEICLYVFGGILIIYSLTNDIIHGSPFGFGMAQGYMLFNGLLLIYSGYLISKEQFTKNFYHIFYFSFVFLFIVLKTKIYDLDGFRTWNDTLSYVHTTIIPLDQLGFWNGDRPFVLPLIYKLFGVNSTNYFDVTLMREILKLQFIVGILSWSLLAYSVKYLFQSIPFKLFASTLVFILGLGLPASMWDKLLLSESLSNSFFILIISFLIILSSRKKGKRFITITISFVLGVTAFLYLFIRDANAYIVLFGSLIGFLCWLFMRIKRNQKKLLLGGSLLGIVLSLLCLILVNQSSRWWAPIQHVLYDKRNTVKDMAPFFNENGFDLFENTTYLMDPLAFKKTSISLDPILKMEKLKTAKSIYIKYLLDHPKYTIFAPFSEFNNIFNPNNLPYRYSIEETPTWVEQLSDFGYPKGVWVFVTGVLCCFIYLLLDKTKSQPSILIILFLILSVIPLGMIYWLSDSIELQRHSQQLYLQSRIGLWLSILLVFESIIRIVCINWRMKKQKIDK